MIFSSKNQRGIKEWLIGESGLRKSGTDGPNARFENSKIYTGEKNENEARENVLLLLKCLSKLYQGSTDKQAVRTGWL